MNWEGEEVVGVEVVAAAIVEEAEDLHPEDVVKKKNTFFFIFVCIPFTVWIV
jgi:hypothetical protein